MKDATDHFAAGIKSRDRIPIGAEHLRAFVDLKPAEGKRDAARHRISDERRRIELLRPVRFRQSESARRHPVALARIERSVTGGGVEFVESAYRSFAIEVEFADQVVEPFGGYRFARGVARFQQRSHFRVENLVSDSA